jgi:hypothetical protein
MIDALLLIASGMCLMASFMALADPRERCYFCWRRSWGHASASAKAERSETTWTVTRYHCRRHESDALDLAMGTSSRLATASAGKP